MERSSPSVTAVGMGIAQQPVRLDNKKFWSKPEWWVWKKLDNLQAIPCRRKHLRWQIMLEQVISETFKIRRISPA